MEAEDIAFSARLKPSADPRKKRKGGEEGVGRNGGKGKEKEKGRETGREKVAS